MAAITSAASGLWSAAAVAAVAARVRELLHLADQAATDLYLIFVAHLMAEM